MSKENENMPKENGKGKGLGWIPEYPDLRDYSIGNEEKLRFKIEEKIARDEKIAEDLILLIESLNSEDKSFAFQGDNKIRQRQIDDFKNKILGQVKFIKVKVHHIFRYPSLQEEKPINNLPDKNSLFIQQILELKKYLSIMVMKNKDLEKNYKKLYNEIEESGYKLINFNEVKEVVNWMREEDYDLTTLTIIKLLQHHFQIRNDGIFGLETYTTLNQYFSGKNGLLPIKENNCDLSSNQKSLSKIRFVSIASLTPITALDKILDILIENTVESIYSAKFQEIKEKGKQDSVIFEYDFLENQIEGKQKNKTFFKKYLQEDFEYIINLIDENNNKKDLESIISLIDRYHIDKCNQKNSEDSSDEKENTSNASNSKCKNNNEGIDINNANAIKNKLSDYLWSHIRNDDSESSLRYTEIVEVLRSSYLIEPIISTILKILCPLGQFKNQSFEELIEQGLKQFESILSCKSKENHENLQNYKELLELSEAAVEKVLFFLKMEINSLIDKEEDFVSRDKYKYNSHIFLCFLITKYISKNYENIVKNNNTRNKNERNIFDKQEVFEIDYREDLNKEDSELFPTLEISIPVSGNDIIQQFKSNLREKGEKKLYSLLPGVIDLSFWCSPVRDQGSLNSCTAFAAISLFEYFVNKNFNKNVDASPLFLYKAARNKMSLTEDVGASIRETMKALALYGVPPEDSWSYDEEKVNEEPPAYCYAYAQNYQSLKYFLLDYAGIPKETLLFQIKAVLAAGFPCIFGFTIYSSAYEDSNEPGHIPFPNTERDKVIGGHTVVAVGYDDYQFIQSANRKEYSKGAFLIRNSWGSNWGISGYGWLPYDYVLAGLTAAWWSLIKSEWFDEGNFGPAGSGGGGCSGGKPC